MIYMRWNSRNKISWRRNNWSKVFSQWIGESKIFWKWKNGDEIVFCNFKSIYIFFKIYHRVFCAITSGYYFSRNIIAMCCFFISNGKYLKKNLMWINLTYFIHLFHFNNSRSRIACEYIIHFVILNNFNAGDKILGNQWTYQINFSFFYLQHVNNPLRYSHDLCVRYEMMRFASIH